MAKTTGKKKAKKAAPRVTSEQMMQMIREEYLPSQLQIMMQEVMSIEINAKWLATDAGLAVEGYTKEEAKSVLDKQAKRKAQLLEKVKLIRAEIDK